MPEKTVIAKDGWFTFEGLVFLLAEAIEIIVHKRTVTARITEDPQAEIQNDRPNVSASPE